MKKRRRNFPFKFSFLSFWSGMTLVEILVSLTIMTIVLGAIYSLLHLQRTKALQVQRTTTLQTEAQVALTLLKWDLATVGLAYPRENDALDSYNGGANYIDSISLKAVGLGFEASKVKASWLLESSSTNQVKVRRMEDSLDNFSVGDTVIVMNVEREILSPPGELVIQDMDSIEFVGVGGDTFPGWRLTLDNPLNAVAGLVMITKYSKTYDGMMIGVNNNKLMRGNEVLLENVEDLQFAYGLDTDDDGVIDTWTYDVPSFATEGKKWSIRYTLVLASEPMSGYMYPTDQITIEDHRYMLTDEQRRRKRAVLTGDIIPINLQPEGEE
jgi:prepilin-type N-terminal cleavage/methylation domain-containing protein